MADVRSNFGTKLGVVLAAAGSAVGLGNIWRFPTELGSNGGAAFFLLYIVCVLLVGLPIMISEFIIGRHTHANTITAYRRLAPRQWWVVGGVEGVLVAFLILSYYIIVSGWTLYYTVASLSMQLRSCIDYSALFCDFSAHPWKPIAYAVAFILAVHVIIVNGVRNGIERFSKLMMPMLLLIIAVLVVCSFSMSGFRDGMAFLLKPDFTKVTYSTILAALGQAFYSLSLAMGCLCTYASYFGDRTNLMKTAFSVVSIDTMVAVLAGFIIFPAVFSVGVAPDAGPGLVFITLPSVFNMAFASVPVVGWLFSSLFYVLLLLAALTSAISLREPVAADLHEEWHLTRKKAALVVTLACIVLSIPCSLSFGLLKGVPTDEMGFFDLFDSLTAKFLMPLGGIIIALFAGWRVPRKVIEDELSNGGHLRVPLLRVYLFLVRWVAPAAIAFIFVNQLLGQ